MLASLDTLARHPAHKQIEGWYTYYAEIARASYDIDNYRQIMGVVARRLQDTEEDWRHVYKSLLLLEFMSKHGPQKVLSKVPCMHLLHACCL